MRVVCLLVLGGFLARAQGVQLVACAVVVGVSLVIVGTPAWRASWRMLWRLRWLFLSLLLVYGWFTPGVPPGMSHTHAWAAWLPSAAGLVAGSWRVAALMLMVVAVNVLLSSTSREALMGAVRWLAAPLAPLGLSRDRLAVRMTLALEAVGEIQAMIRPALRASGERQPVARAAETASHLFREAERRAEAAACTPVTVPAHGSPAAPQWLWPLALATTLLLMP